MTEASGNTKKWRHSIKTKFIEILGGKCCACGYNKCIQALEFHHVNPSKKESEISRMIVGGNINDDFYNEIRKCICLCSNCHKELHAGIINCPPLSINEDMLNAEIERRKPVVKECKVCGRNTSQSGGMCISCYNISKRKFNPTKEELEQLLEKNTIVKVAEYFGVSDAAVIRRCKNMGIYKRRKRASILVV